MQTLTALGRKEGAPLMHLRGPLAGRYWPTAAMVVFALVPFLGLASVLAATAADPAMFIAGHVLQGLSTSLLLIAAAPPLVAGFKKLSRLRWTTVITNLGIFGAVALGPWSARPRRPSAPGGRCSGSWPPLPWPRSCSWS
ncbi:MAG: hypothetical protein ACRDZX_05710 [Acidimicrobiales bacterium]